MPKFGQRSMDNLYEAHYNLLELFNEIIKYYDCSIIDGHRTEAEQNEAYEKGFSKVKYPNSKHNRLPSLAVDAMPWFEEYPHIRWEDNEKLYEFAGFVQGVAAVLGIKIRWGGNWDMDDELHDQSFYDFCHFELIGDSN